MTKNRETTHTQNPILLAIGARDDVIVWRQQSGMFRQLTPPHTPIRVGQVGQSDLGGIVAVTITPEMVGKTIGVAVQMELKTETGRPTREQLGWGRAVQQRGGVFRVVRSVPEAEELIRDIQAGTAW